jgi:hypothetical protein
MTNQINQYQPAQRRRFMTPTISALRTATTSTPIAEILRILKEDGGVIIKNFLTQSQIDSFNAEIQGPMDALAPGFTAQTPSA